MEAQRQGLSRLPEDKVQTQEVVYIADRYLIRTLNNSSSSPKLHHFHTMPTFELTSVNLGAASTTPTAALATAAGVNALVPSITGASMIHTSTGDTSAWLGTPTNNGDTVVTVSMTPQDCADLGQCLQKRARCADRGRG